LAGICYVAPDIAVPSPRGAATHILELSAALADLGDEVHVVTNRLEGQKQVEEVRRVTIHRVSRLPLGITQAPAGPGRRANESGSSGFQSLAYRMYLQTLNAARVGNFSADIIRRHNLDAVLERETAYGAGAFASFVTNRPLLLEIIGPRSSPLSLSRCFKLLAYSSLMVPEQFRSKAEYVEAAVNLGIFKPDEASGARVREQLGFGGQIVVGYVGTFQSFHGVDDLLRAAAIALKSHPELKFLLVGPQSPSSVQLVGDLGITSHVTFTGAVKYEDVPAFINASDIMVAPYRTVGTDRESHGIGSPLKVLEYMAVGKPTIGSSLPQLEAIIQDGFTGRLFPQGDTARLAGIITELAEGPAEREKLGRNGLALVSQRYAWTTLAGRINDLIARQSRQDSR